MTYAMAWNILDRQDRELRKLNKMRYFYNGYEYRITYEGGFAPIISLDRRWTGTRNFKYYKAIDVSHCATQADALALIKTTITGRK